MGIAQGQDKSAANEGAGSGLPSPDQGPSHRLLEAFVGTWKVEGVSNGSSVPVESSGTEDYRWLEGEFFLEYRWTRMYGKQKHSGIGLIGFDKAKDGYFTKNFDNLGYYREYETAIDKGLMTLKGETERATIGLNAAENNITIDWEFSKDGKTWSPLCHLKGFREN